MMSRRARGAVIDTSRIRLRKACRGSQAAIEMEETWTGSWCRGGARRVPVCVQVVVKASGRRSDPGDAALEVGGQPS
eukprot:1611594-Rhodomonas_salina.2